MIANAPSSTEAVPVLRGVQKAATLLILLGDQASAELIKGLPEDDVQLVAREIARMKKITPDHAEAVLEEFYQMMMARNYVITGGIDYARSVLVNAFGPEAARKLLDRLLKAMGTDMSSFDA